MSDRRDPDVHRLVMDWPDDAIAEIERLRTRQSCEGDQPYICHALATARSRLADWHKVADDRSAEIVRLNARLAEAEALLDEVAYYPLQFAAKEPTARSVYERIKVFRAADSAPAVDCDWCKGSGRFINGEIWSWTQDGPKRGRCSCVCHTAADQPSSAPAAACEWTQDLDGNWATCCGEMWCLIDGTPTDNDMTYCHHCGKRIKESLYLDPDDDGVEADQPGEVVK